MLSYDKLWHLLLDKKIHKSELCKLTGISSSTMAKLSKDQLVSLSVIERICNELHCDIGEIMRFK